MESGKSNSRNHREQNGCDPETGEQRKGDFGSGVQTFNYKSQESNMLMGLLLITQTFMLNVL